VKDVTRASLSSVSAVFMDTLMMWIGFSLVFCRMRKNSVAVVIQMKISVLLIRRCLLDPPAHLELLLLKQTGVGL